MDSYSTGELNDEPQSQEIKLLGELVLAASGMTRHLTRDEVDQALGLSRPTPARPAPTTTRSSLPAVEAAHGSADVDAAPPRVP